jgi:predicted RNase H-like HicB family nuclease
MTENFAYPASLVPDEAGFYLVTFPDFPEAATDGESHEEAIEEASGALAEAIAGRMNRGDTIHPLVGWDFHPRKSASPPTPKLHQMPYWHGLLRISVD